ncbi:MAG: extracellular solute-binding protein [Gammaproteobacteria bacterium]
MANMFSNRYSRRAFLRKASKLSALGMATSLTPDLIFAESKVDLAGLEIDYWNMIGVQNKTVREQSETIIKAFEQRTGCKVNVTWNSYGDIIGPKYRTNFIGNVKPTVFDTSSRWVGQLRSFMRPLDDFIESELDADARAGIDWMFPLFRRQTSGFADASSNYAIPLNLVPQAPYILNRDHFDKAGIDFDANYPIHDSISYVELCKSCRLQPDQSPDRGVWQIWDFAPIRG